MSRTPEAVKHTPEPLQVISGPDGYSPAIALDDKRGAFIIAEMRDYQMKGDDIVDATAERLVLAYNVHEEMLSALKELVGRAYALLSPEYGGKNNQFDHETWRKIGYEIRRAEAAITKAEGK